MVRMDYLPAPLPFSLWDRFLPCKPGSCSVYGSGPEAKAFLKLLGKDGVRGNDRYLRKTAYHVVMLESDFATSLFCQGQLGLITKEPIVAVVEDAARFSPPRDNIRAVSIMETAVTLYWSGYPAKPDEKIAFLGNDPLLSTLLYQGLCQNIYASSQCIQYHIWGSTPTTGLLRGIGSISMDKILIHNQPWQKEWAALTSMGRIVLCGDEPDNQAALQQLSTLPSCPPIYVYEGGVAKATQPDRALEPKGFPLPVPPLSPPMPAYASAFSREGAIPQWPAGFSQGKVIHFGAFEDTLRKEIILEEALLQEAKQLYDRNRQQYGGEPWERLCPALKQSSISTASYFPVLRRLFKAGIPLETLAELEHIRWYRFNCMNFSPDIPLSGRIAENGGIPLYVPYTRLSEEEKQKKRNNVMLAISQTM